MRSTIIFFAALALAAALAGCERSQPAASPESCGCAATPSSRPEPPREEPADIMR